MKTIVNNKFYILIFIILAVIVYSPTFLNGFVWDDFNYIVNNNQIHSFNMSILFDNLYNSGQVYRQFMPVYIALIYTFFSGSSIVFHLLQLIMHIIATFLIFILLKKYYSAVISFFLSLLFLLHPINAEAVLWISAVQIPSLTIFGILSLLIVHSKNMSEKKIYLLGICLFIAIFSYEASIYYFVLVVFYLYLHKSNQLKKVAFMCLGILLFYVIFRFITNTLFSEHLYADVNSKATLVQQMATIPSIILYYFKTLIFPKDLMVWQSWYIHDVNFWSVIIPILIIQLSLIVYASIFFRIKKKDRIPLYFFTLWLFLGMSVVLQFIPLDMTVADRWFYFPFIGLLGIMGYFFQYYRKKTAKYKKIIIIVTVILLCLYSVRTYIRAHDWKDEITLFSHDIQYEPENYELNYNLSHDYIMRDDCNHALIYIEKMISINPQVFDVLYKAGKCYYEIGRYDLAIIAFNKAIEASDNPDAIKIPDNYIFLADSYLKLHRYEEVLRIVSDKILHDSPFAYLLLIDRAKAEIYLGKFDLAEKDIQALKKYPMDNEIAEIIKLYEEKK